MPKNRHKIKFEFDVECDGRGDPTDMTVQASVTFEVSDPETLQQTIALLKKHDVKSMGDLIDILGRLSEQSALEASPVIQAKKKAIVGGTPVSKSLADALRACAPKGKLFPGDPVVDFKHSYECDMTLGEDMHRVFEKKLGRPLR